MQPHAQLCTAARASRHSQRQAGTFGGEGEAGRVVRPVVQQHGALAAGDESLNGLLCFH